MMVWLVMIGGGLGSGARYLIGRWAVQAFAPPFPYATLIVNVTGCFALGVLAQLAINGTVTPEARTAVAAGFLGGFTTYSSFNQETIALFASGATGAAAANIAITIAAGLMAGLLGATLVRMLQS